MPRDVSRVDRRAVGYAVGVAFRREREFPQAHNGAIVGILGLYIRLGILETPIFARILAEERVERSPSIEVIKQLPFLGG